DKSALWFPRDAGAEISQGEPTRTPQLCLALRAHPERRHAAALQTIRTSRRSGVLRHDVTRDSGTVQ
ncbi:MAG TPA: hypothetical protein PLK89_16280, partial [Acidobacteriota bacterium]|nr:hypothetical protein [Acidobacteriota bacterium]